MAEGEEILLFLCFYILVVFIIIKWHNTIGFVTNVPRCLKIIITVGVLKIIGASQEKIYHILAAVYDYGNIFLIYSPFLLILFNFQRLPLILEFPLIVYVVY